MKSSETAARGGGRGPALHEKEKKEGKAGKRGSYHGARSLSLSAFFTP